MLSVLESWLLLSLLPHPCSSPLHLVSWPISLLCCPHACHCSCPLVSITAFVVAMPLSLKSLLLTSLLTLLAIINGSKNLWRCTWESCQSIHSLMLAVASVLCLQRVCHWFRFEPVQNQFSKIHMFLNLELDYRFGSAKSLNFELDLGLVQEGSGLNLGSELNHSNTIYHAFLHT
jgi:hypothetical protein